MIDIKECNIYKYGIDMYGWSGSVSVLIAYSMITFESDKDILIDIFNLYGSTSIGYMCYREKVWQAFSLEVAWFFMAAYSLMNHLKS